MNLYGIFIQAERARPEVGNGRRITLDIRGSGLLSHSGILRPWLAVNIGGDVPDLLVCEGISLRKGHVHLYEPRELSDMEQARSLVIGPGPPEGREWDIMAGPGSQPSAAWQSAHLAA